MATWIKQAPNEVTGDNEYVRSTAPLVIVTVMQSSVYCLCQPSTTVLKEYFFGDLQQLGTVHGLGILEGHWKRCSE